MEGLIQDRDEMIIEFMNKLEKAQKQMQSSANKKRMDVEFQEGDLVYLKLRPYRQV